MTTDIDPELLTCESMARKFRSDAIDAVIDRQDGLRALADAKAIVDRMEARRTETDHARRLRENRYTDNPAGAEARESDQRAVNLAAKRAAHPDVLYNQDGAVVSFNPVTLLRSMGLPVPQGAIDAVQAIENGDRA